jgi:membrane protein involved in colicin uptake
MTQEEFNTALAARLKKYADYDELKKAADKYKVIEDANKTEVEKLREAAATAQTKATQLEAQARESTLKGAVIAEAAKQGFADPMDAYKLLDVTKMELAEDGTVKGLTEALTALAAAKPYLRAKNAPVVPPANPPRDSGSQKRTDEDRRQEYFGGRRTDFWTPEGQK